MTIFGRILQGTNKLLSTIWDQKVKLGVIVAKQEEKLPSVLPKVTVTAPKIIFGQEGKINYTPYLIAGGVIVGIILITR